MAESDDIEVVQKYKTADGELHATLHLAKEHTRKLNFCDWYYNLTNNDTRLFVSCTGQVDPKVLYAWLQTNRDVLPKFLP